LGAICHVGDAEGDGFAEGSGLFEGDDELLSVVVKTLFGTSNPHVLDVEIHGI
jgi:hypothetical protein